jgi:dihydrofolate reductase
MTLSLIVAVSKNNVIGRHHQLPWRLSADLRQFKRLTMGHHLIMGRRTYESIGRALPGRTTIVVTRQANFVAEGCMVAHDLPKAIELARGDDQVFVVGGRQIYELALSLCDRMYWTAVDADVPGDTFFASVDWSQWELVSETSHPADERNEFATSFRVYHRIR